MKTSGTSRRAFLKSSGSLLSGSWIAMNMPLILAATQTAISRRAEGRSWVNLEDEEAAELAAIAEQIFPADESPGAIEVGVVYFMDAAFGGFMAGAAPMIREGLATLQDRAAGMQEGVRLFSELEFHQQTEVLRSMEASPFFRTVHFMTLCGLFALPEHGGNRDKAGWKLLGFEDRHVWQSPFGHYDAQYLTGVEDASA